MKIVVKSVAALKVPLIKLVIQGTSFNMLDLLGLFNGAMCTEDAAGAGAVDVYLNFPFTITSVTDDVPNVLNWETIDNKDEVEIQNIAIASIQQFVAGRAYLVKNTVLAPTLIIPAMKSIVVGDSALGTAAVVYTAKYYLYNCSTTANTLSTTSVGIIQFDIDKGAVARNAARRAGTKQLEEANFSAAASTI